MGRDYKKHLMVMLLCSLVGLKKGPTKKASGLASVELPTSKSKLDCTTFATMAGSDVITFRSLSRRPARLSRSKKGLNSQSQSSAPAFSTSWAANVWESTIVSIIRLAQDRIVCRQRPLRLHGSQCHVCGRGRTNLEGVGLGNRSL